MSNVINIEDKSEFEAAVASGEVVVKFTAPAWCGPCRAFAPHFAAVSELHDAKFIAVDIDKAEWAVAEYGVQSVPTVKLYREGVYITDLAKTQANRSSVKFLAELSNA